MDHGPTDAEDAEHRPFTISRRGALVAGGSLMGTIAAVLAGLPAAAGAAEDALTSTRVDLVIGDRITGTWGKTHIDAAFTEGKSGHAHGTLGKLAYDAKWTVADNTAHSPVPATLNATLGKQKLSLHGDFTLEPNYLLKQGVVSGATAGHAVHATVKPASGPTTSSVSVTGKFGPFPFSLNGAITDQPLGGTVHGTVNGKPVKVTATQKSDGSLAVSGDYAGPPELFAIIVGCLRYFT